MAMIIRTTSDNVDFHKLVVELDKELWKRYPADIQAEYAPHNKIINLPTVVLAYVDDQPVGCGCFKRFDDRSVEIKRMFVKEDQRGKGIAANILKELEQWAKELSYENIVLETGSRQPEAIHLYKKLGYHTIDAYPPYTGMSDSICFKKSL